MDYQDVLRKIEALRRIKLEYGAYPGEVQNAERLRRKLADRLSARAEKAGLKTATAVAVDTASAARPRPPTWSWKDLLGELGFRLSRFGKHGTVSLGPIGVLHIKLETGCWRVEGRSSTRSRVPSEGSGLESLRRYLISNGLRPYSFAKTG
jgi:hypothetical protein